MYDLIIIGGGAAGLVAAGTAAEKGLHVLLLEKMEKPARKVRITGKGRCNLTNIRSESEFMERIQANRTFFIPAYRSFSNRDTMRLFERLGVKLSVEQGGRVFPKSGKSWDIADALEGWCKESGVEILCRCQVTEILLLGDKVRGVNYRNRNGFIRKAEAPAVILCTGGASYPATGSTGDGYALAHALGHRIEPIRPSLVPLETSWPEAESLQGLHLRNIRIGLSVDGQTVQDILGEMSFSNRGLEGAAILRLSRKAVDALIDERNVELILDLKPALDAETLRQRIARERELLPSEATAGELLRKLMPRELVLPIARASHISPRLLSTRLTEEMIESLILRLKETRIPVSDYRPFEEAVVTAGGISVDEVNPETLESHIIKGLYFAGEVLDLDADTGGYNLQIAFSTGHLAAQLKKNTAL